MHPPAPFPFLNRKEADEVWNMFGSGVRIELIEDDYEDSMLDLWLRVQAKGGSRHWSMQPSRSWNQRERFQFSMMQVDYGTGIRMFIFYVFPVINNVPMLTDSGEGCGLFVLELPLISAYCRTVTEAIAAIDAVASYIPTLIIRRDESIARGFLRSHYSRVRKLLVSNSTEPDRVMLASLDRSLSRLVEEDERELGGYSY